MDERELAAAVESLSSSLRHTQAELHAVRTVLIGLLRGLSSEPIASDRIAAAIAAAVEAEKALALGSATPDQLLELRSRWLEVLLPQKWQP